MKKFFLIIIIFFNMIAICFSEIKKVDAFFANIGGRFSYEASFDKEGNIINLIRIYDFKNLKSSNGCFDINFFDQNSKIYKFLKSKNLKNFCNDD